MRVFADRVSDLCNVPPGRDKSNIPHMAVVGIGGMGKTELLRTIQSLDLRVNQSAHADPYWAEFCTATTCATNGVGDSSVRPAVKEAVVMFATFGEETVFDETQDTRTAIVPRTVLRMINDYFLLGFKDAADDLDFDKLAQTMCQYVMSRSDGNLSEDDVAVVLCVDELRKIVVDETRRALLSALAAFQQEELNHKRRTFIVVSSVDLWPLHEEWVAWAKRRLTPLRLPRVPLDALINAETKNLPRAGDQDGWADFVTACISSTGGHPGTLEQAMRDIERARKDADGSWKFTGSAAMAKPHIAAFWWLCMRHIVLGHTCFTTDTDMQAQTEDGAHLRYFVDGHFAMVEHVTGGDGQANLRLILTPIPYAFVAAQVDRNDECGGVRGDWLCALGFALYNSHQKVAEKAWEAGMLAAVALHAQARADAVAASTADHDVGPCLSAVLPKDPTQCQFSSDAVKHWRIPIATMRAFEDTSELWPAPSKTLVRLSPDEKQPAVEGSIELVDDKGQRAVGWFQHKLYPKLAASKLAVFIRKIKLFHDKNYRGTPMCAILFCTGITEEALLTTLENAIKKYPALKDVNYICIGPHGCVELLKPFGASVLATKIARRVGRSKRREGGQKQ